ncbi:hypothetical protein SERLA73DRAFT_72690 [Serpula lacrymans var. lacrymans S7.3]|uniref:Uncharacterized protein n=2 Tax=Serpula lacrymans var. lacrymans TaxID=341189 RepID=F8PWB2_SERL3|nr:uncharacterized protein SERLADRAFT_437221 [Serpula lacrymans var. lacrymans S7.9]EGN99917.1 hypothetical protein SERLA73DRAFT_72690 [Serpula lacrymans var. lacrymans S7.3]EGO25486.1 hypothetical protein SERLADRAFT_437221 [Serpula lacrymans var. lacrymans S7.9]
MPSLALVSLSLPTLFSPRPRLLHHETISLASHPLAPPMHSHSTIIILSTHLLAHNNPNTINLAHPSDLPIARPGTPSQHPPIRLPGVKYPLTQHLTALYVPLLHPAPGFSRRYHHTPTGLLIHTPISTCFKFPLLFYPNSDDQRFGSDQF